MSNRHYSSDDSSTSSSLESSAWMDYSSRSIDEFDDYSEPQQKKTKRSHQSSSSNTEYIEGELKYDHLLKATYKWTIKDFSRICQEQKSGEKIESPVFTIGTNEELKWSIQLYPKGSDQNKNYLSVYLQLISSKEPKIKVQYKCCIINNKGKETNELSGDDYFVEGQSFGFKKFLKTESVLRCSNMLVNDRLVLKFDINATLSKLSANKVKVVNDLKILFESGNYSDVTLEVQNKKFKVHKFILAARSPVFSAMFQHDMKEKKLNIVEITDMAYSIMEELLRFIYTGEVKNLDVTVKDLLAAADRYALEDLKLICENELCKNLSVSNVVDILNFAELHNAVKLKQEALSFMVQNVKDVINTSSFKIMGKTQSPLLADVICIMASQQNYYSS